MLKYYVTTTEALKRLGRDKDGIVSFEYIIVAVLSSAQCSACVRYWTGSAMWNSADRRDHR